MQHPDAIHRVARECALDLAADGVVYAEVRFAPSSRRRTGCAIEDVVEAMVDGFSDGGREATEAGTPIRVGALLCAMRQNDRWEEVAGLVGPLPRRRRRRVRPRRPGDRLPARPPALGDRHARSAPGRTAPSTPGRPTGSRASGPRSTARTPSARGTASGSPTRWPRTAPLGSLAKRVLESRCRWRSRRRPTCRPAPSRRWPRTPSTGCTGWASPSPVNHRQPADQRGVVRQRDGRGREDLGSSWDDVQTVTERALGAAFLADGRPGAPAHRVVRPGTRRCSADRGDGCHRRPGNAGAIFAANLGVPAQRPVPPGRFVRASSASVQIPRSTPGRS